MSQIATLILIIVMAFSSVIGTTGNVEGTNSFEAKIGLDMESVMAMSGMNTAESTDPQQTRAIEDILGAITLKGAADQDTAELDLYAGDDLMLSLGVKKGEEGSLLASTLLGKTVLFCSNEILEQTQQMLMQSMQQQSTVASASSSVDMQAMIEKMQAMDWAQISKDFAEATAKISQVIEEKRGEVETGEFVVDGLTFTAKVPVNITYEELTELLLTTAKELAGKDSVKPLLETVAQGTDINAEIDKALENLKNQPENQKYDLAIAAYADEAGNGYTAIDCSRPASEDGTVQAEDVHVGVGVAENQTKVLVTAQNGTRFELTAGAAEGGAFALQANVNGEGFAATADALIGADGSSDVTVDVTVQGMPVRSHTVTTVGEERVNFNVEVFMMNLEKPMVTVTGSAGKGGELVSVFEGEDITVTPVEKLMDESDTTAANQVQMAIMTGLMKGISTLSKNVPEETGKWLSQMLQQTLNPGEVTKTAP